jgi:putative ABC transport system substrate-binding protein
MILVPLALEAQQAGRTVTIGYLGNSSPSLESNAVEAFREGLRQLGYVEGHNLIIKYQWAEGQQERSAVLAAELVRLKPDVILTSGTPGTHAAKQATQSIPIVTAVAGDPVATGLVSSLAKPGGNVTGLATLNEELEGKRLEIFKQVVPKLSRVAVLLNPANPFTTIALKGTRSAWRQARRPAHGAADDVRAGDQPENGEGVRPHDSAVSARAGGSSHRIARAGP